MKKFRPFFSSVMQLLSLLLIIHLAFIKTEITDRDLIKAIMFVGFYIIEEIRQLKWTLEENNTNNNNQ